MSLKSLVNKSVIKSDLRRFWYMGALFLAMLLLTAVLPATNYENRIYADFESRVILSTPIVILFGIVIPAVIFSYMQGKSSSAMAHSLPLRRECLYISHIASVWVLILLPLAVSTLMMLSAEGVPSAEVLKWAGHKLVYAFLLTSFGTLASMLAGNIFASIILPFIVILLPIYIDFTLYTLCNNYLYGFAESGLSALVLYDVNTMLYIYPALGALCYALGLVCYKKRAIENNSRLVAFNVLNNIFLYGFALCLGFLGYIYISAINGIDKHMWIALPFGIIGIIAARMLINRSFKPGNIIKPIIIYTAMLLVIYAFVGLDITGYEKRVPKIGDIEYAAINEYSNSFYDADIAPAANIGIRMTEKEDIKKLIALHKGIVDKHEEVYDYYLPITYRLKDGRILKREYNFKMDETLSGLYNGVMNTTPAKQDRFPILSAGEDEYTSAQVTVCGADSINLTNEQISEIAEALKEDITEADYSELNGDTLTAVSITQKIPSADRSGKIISDKNKWVTEDYLYNIHSAYKRTIALLTEWGLYNKMPDPDSVKSATIVVNNDNGQNVEEITDKDTIKKLLDSLYNNGDELKTYASKTSITIHYTGDSAWSAYLDKLPE